MTTPTDEQIEAGRMALVDATGHGYGPELVRAVYDAMRGAGAPAIVPDELVKAVERMIAVVNRDGIPDTDMWRAAQLLHRTLALPRRTEDSIRADERERMAKYLDGVAGKIHHDAINRPHRSAQVSGHCRSAAVQDAADMIRSQGGDDE
jgi:hypothetical protein